MHSACDCQNSVSLAALLLARPPQVGECLAQVGGRREISADGVHISPIDVLMKLQQKPEWADVSISLVHRAIAAAPKLMCRGERMAEWHTKRLVDAEQQQAMANLSSLPSWVRCTLEDIRAHQLDLAQQCVGRCSCCR